MSFLSSTSPLDKAVDKLNAIKAEISKIGSDSEFKDKVIAACPDLKKYTFTVNNRLQLLIMYAEQKKNDECKPQKHNPIVKGGRKSKRLYGKNKNRASKKNRKTKRNMKKH